MNRCSVLVALLSLGTSARPAETATRAHETETKAVAEAMRVVGAGLPAPALALPYSAAALERHPKRAWARAGLIDRSSTGSSRPGLVPATSAASSSDGLRDQEAAPSGAFPGPRARAETPTDNLASSRATLGSGAPLVRVAVASTMVTRTGASRARASTSAGGIQIADVSIGSVSCAAVVDAAGPHYELSLAQLTIADHHISDVDLKGSDADGELGKRLRTFEADIASVRLPPKDSRERVVVRLLRPTESRKGDRLEVLAPAMEVSVRSSRTAYTVTLGNCRARLAATREGPTEPQPKWRPRYRAYRRKPAGVVVPDTRAVKHAIALKRLPVESRRATERHRRGPRPRRHSLLGVVVIGVAALTFGQQVGRSRVRLHHRGQA